MTSITNNCHLRDRHVILLRCPGCSQKLRTGAHNLGGAVRCPRCWHKIQVPAAETDPRPSEARNHRATGRVDRPAPGPASRDAITDTRLALLEVRSLQQARSRCLERIGAEARAQGAIPEECESSLCELLAAIEARIDCFNALCESRAPRRVLGSARASLARLGERRDSLLRELGRQALRSGSATADQQERIAHLEDRIAVIQAALGSRSTGLRPGRVAIAAAILALLISGGWIGFALIRG
ncbi:MAG: hypothetical protein U0790_03925 [Isosphaeraceae bacterium]